MAKKLTKGSLLGFVRSRPYISIADLRRRFQLEAEDACAVRGPEGFVYVGLPRPAADILQELWAAGLVGLHFAPNVKARAVEGVYPTQIVEGKRKKGRASQPAPRAASQEAQAGGQAPAAASEDAVDDEEDEEG